MHTLMGGVRVVSWTWTTLAWTWLCRGTCWALATLFKATATALIAIVTIEVTLTTLAALTTTWAALTAVLEATTTALIAIIVLATALKALRTVGARVLGTARIMLVMRIVTVQACWAHKHTRVRSWCRTGSMSSWRCRGVLGGASMSRSRCCWTCSRAWAWLDTSSRAGTSARSARCWLVGWSRACLL